MKLHFGEYYPTIADLEQMTVSQMWVCMEATERRSEELAREIEDIKKSGK